MELPDGVLAYRVLNSANLSNEQMTLCRATMMDLKYPEMVKQLKRLFADGITSTPIGAQATYQPNKEPVKGILNPVDKDGNIKRCITYDSKYH